MPGPPPDRTAPPVDAYAQFRAPKADDTALVDPEWGEQLRQLGDSASPPSIALGGAPLAEVVAEARRELLRIAAEHTRCEAPPAAGPLVVSGHQPELFHPGVWYKNFALDALAKASGGVGIHLVVDSDLCRVPSITVPTGTVEAPQLVAVPYDQQATPLPHEERRVLDVELWDSFPQRLVDAVGALCPEPLVRSIWPDAIAARDGGATLGEALCHARHALERRYGSATLEAPMSRVCDTTAFRSFAAELLLRGVESRDAYNAALADYRVAHGLRNAAQPLPDLASDGEWCETPLWVWSIEDPTRRPLWARANAGGVELRDDRHWNWQGPRDPDALVQELGELRSGGVKVRSRALATTLFCRLVLADLFLHGIGGAKYDQVTDRWSQRLLGVAPPPHATLTATLQLPIAKSLSGDDPAELRRALRQLRYHPEVGLAPGVAREAIDLKRRWVGKPKTPGNAAERHAAILAANAAMRDARAGEQDALLARIARAEEEGRAMKVLGSREHPFCLFAEDEIVPRLQRLATIPKPTATAGVKP